MLFRSELVEAWAAQGLLSDEDLDRDRVGVFWALLFLSAQGKLELHQEGGLFGHLRLRRLRDASEDAIPTLQVPEGSDGPPALEARAA